MRGQAPARVLPRHGHGRALRRRRVRNCVPRTSNSPRPRPRWSRDCWRSSAIRWITTDSRSSQGVSIEVALSATDGGDADGLIKRADLALYRAKAEGRRALFASSRRRWTRAPSRRALEIDLRQAVIRTSWSCTISPRSISSPTSSSDSDRWCVGAIRTWMISPLDFIPLAEEPGSSAASANGSCTGHARRAGVAELDQGGRQRIAGAVPGPASSRLSPRSSRTRGSAEQARARNHRVDIAA